MHLMATSRQREQHFDSLGIIDGLAENDAIDIDSGVRGNHDGPNIHRTNSLHDCI